MSFSKMMELLQIKHKNKIVICNAGEFYIAIGKDAILLSNILNLKLTCLKPEVCKVGFPITALEKYTDLIYEQKYSFIVYYFNQKSNKLEILIDYNGKNKNEIFLHNNNCYICSKGTKKYKQPDKYIEALAQLYKEEIEENERKRQ